MDFALLKSELTRDEGLRPKAYLDTKGKVTVGIGHNLTDKPLSARAIQVIYEDDSNDAVSELDKSIPWWRNLSEARQRVLANMTFNMGIGGVLEFKNTLALIQSGDYEQAASEMLDSKWAAQVGDRAQRLSKMMREG